jgi:hypothetical protein
MFADRGVGLLQRFPVASDRLEDALQLLDPPSLLRSGAREPLGVLLLEPLLELLQLDVVPEGPPELLRLGQVPGPVRGLLALLLVLGLRCRPGPLLGALDKAPPVLQELLLIAAVPLEDLEGLVPGAFPPVRSVGG